MHTESGYLRARPDGIELMIAQPSGVVEVLEGTLDGHDLRLDSTLVGRTSSAKELHATSRRYVLVGDTLTAELSMAAVGRPPR